MIFFPPVTAADGDFMGLSLSNALNSIPADASIQIWDANGNKLEDTTDCKLGSCDLGAGGTLFASVAAGFCTNCVAPGEMVLPVAIVYFGSSTSGFEDPFFLGRPVLLPTLEVFRDGATAIWGWAGTARVRGPNGGPPSGGLAPLP
jgi:hypothetical protein